MKKIICLFLLLVGHAVIAKAQIGCVELMEIDGSPDIKCVRIIRVTNGTLTRNGSTGTITISGGGGSGTINSGTNKRLAFYLGTGTTLDDAAGVEYNSAGTPGIVAVTHNSANVQINYESGASLSSTQVNSNPALLTLQTKDDSTYYQLAYINEAGGKIANYMDSNAALWWEFYATNDTQYGNLTFWRYGGIGAYRNSADWGGFYEAGTDLFALGVITSGTDGSLNTHRVFWSNSGVTSYAPATALADGSVAASNVHFHLTEASDLLSVKWKESGGTVFNKSILMTDGSGASLTALNATQLTSGTVPLARLSGITNTEISASAAIADTKLATISTAGKVSDSALSANVVLENGANTWSTGAQDFGSATSLKVPTSGGLSPTASGLIGYDSTDHIWRVGINGTTAELSTWPISGYVISKPSSSQVVVRFVFDRAMTIPAQTNGVNAYVKAGTSATAQTDFTMSKNGGASFCTLRFVASGTQATFQTCSSTDFAAGDVLTIVAPSSQDATLADIGFSITARMQ